LFAHFGSPERISYTAPQAPGNSRLLNNYAGTLPGICQVSARYHLKPGLPIIWYTINAVFYSNDFLNIKAILEAKTWKMTLS